MYSQSTLSGSSTFIIPLRPYLEKTELSICTTDGSYDGKTPNVASSPRRLSGPLRVVALGGPTEDKFDACAHERNCYLTVSESIRRQIESSPRSKDADDRIYFVSDPERVTHALYPAVSVYFYVDVRVSPCVSPPRADTLMYFPRNRDRFEQVVLLVFVLTFSTLCRIKTISFCSLKNGKII